MVWHIFTFYKELKREYRKCDRGQDILQHATKLTYSNYAKKMNHFHLGICKKRGYVYVSLNKLKRNFHHS